MAGVRRNSSRDLRGCFVTTPLFGVVCLPADGRQSQTGTVVYSNVDFKARGASSALFPLQTKGGAGFRCVFFGVVHCCAAAASTRAPQTQHTTIRNTAKPTTTITTTTATTGDEGQHPLAMCFFLCCLHDCACACMYVKKCAGRRVGRRARAGGASALFYKRDTFLNPKRKY